MQDITDDHNVTVRAEELEIEIVFGQVIAKLLVEKVQFKTVNEPEVHPVIASCNVHHHPIPRKLMAELITTLFVVIVFPVVVDSNFISPVFVQSTPVAVLKFPYVCIAEPEPPTVTTQLAGFQTVRFAQITEPEIVTVYPVALDALSKITSSELVGTEAPEAPPEVDDQFVVEEEFHVPVHQTQYRLAILFD